MLESCFAWGVRSPGPPSVRKGGAAEDGGGAPGEDRPPRAVMCVETAAIRKLLSNGTRAITPRSKAPFGDGFINSLTHSPFM